MSDLPIPVPVTSNNWSPIVTFKPDLPYAQGHFLVWLVKGEEQWFEDCWYQDGRFEGTWRHVCTEEGHPLPEINDLEPVAFKLVEGPNLDDLARIIAHHKLAA